MTCDLKKSFTLLNRYLPEQLEFLQPEPAMGIYYFLVKSPVISLKPALLAYSILAH